MAKIRPVVIAYDISSNKIRAKVLRLLRDWSIGGQKSVHEFRLTNAQAEELFLQISDLINPDKDSLMMAWLEPRRRVQFRGVGGNSVREQVMHIQ